MYFLLPCRARKNAKHDKKSKAKTDIFLTYVDKNVHFITQSNKERKYRK